jgi:transketolase
MQIVFKNIRKDILRISKISGHGHIPTCFSVIEIIYAFYETMKHDPANPSWEERDVFILSKGHASLAQYVVMSKFGYFDIKDVESFGAFKSIFGCHANRLKVRGIEASTGSLGHGIGLAVGMALAFKIKKSDRRVIVVIGDGESNEGSVWEAVMVAVNLKLNNLKIVYDNNMSHQRGLQITNPGDRFKSFGAVVAEVNGHDVAALKNEYISRHDTLKVIIANTVKGFGCKTMINNQYEWHRRSPNEQEYEMLLRELNETTV